MEIFVLFIVVTGVMAKSGYCAWGEIKTTESPVVDV
jgi:hypothetical protein